MRALQLQPLMLVLVLMQALPSVTLVLTQFGLSVSVCGSCVRKFQGEKLIIDSMVLKRVVMLK